MNPTSTGDPVAFRGCAVVQLRTACIQPAYLPSFASIDVLGLAHVEAGVVPPVAVVPAVGALVVGVDVFVELPHAAAIKATDASPTNHRDRRKPFPILFPPVGSLPSR
jgi:hypothetical protein